MISTGLVIFLLAYLCAAALCMALLLEAGVYSDFRKRHSAPVAILYCAVAALAWPLWCLR